MKKNKMKKIFTIGIFVIIFLYFLYYYFKSPFVSEITIEAGDNITIDQLIKDENVKDAKIIDDVNNSLICNVGKYDIMVSGNNREYKIHLNVIDTTPPVAIVYNKKSFWLNDTIQASDFIKEITDYSDVNCYFEKDIDNSLEGVQVANIILEDTSKNKTVYQVELEIKKDTIPPVISAPNVIIANKNESISYKKDVSVTDNRDKDINIQVDNSKVNITKAGVYTVVLSASDQSGNTATKNMQVRILSDSAKKIKEEAYKYADILIEKLCKDNQTKDEKLKIISDYIRENVVYNGIHEGTMENYYVDALTGFKTLRGDCLVSNSMSRVCCERLGIPTIAVKRIKNKDNHYWFLANTGNGWYHYDNWVRKDGPYIHKWTDAQMDAYNKKTRASLYDKSLYPKTPDK